MRRPGDIQSMASLEPEKAKRRAQVARRLVRELRPDFHAKGTDYSAATVPERDTMAALGGRTAIAGDAKRHASRELFERIRRLGGGDG